MLSQDKVRLTHVKDSDIEIIAKIVAGNSRKLWEGEKCGHLNSHGIEELLVLVVALVLTDQDV